MATDAYVFDESFKAENDLSATTNQFKAVELSAENQIDVCDGATDDVIGVLQNTPGQYQAAQVRILGITKMVSDGNAGAIAVGDNLHTDTAGRAIKVSAGAGQRSLGIALSASTAQGTIIDVLLTPGRYLSA